MFNWQAVEPTQKHQEGSSYLPFLGSQKFGWLNEPNNTWCQNWVKMGSIQWEAIKLIPLALCFAFAIVGLILMVVAFFVALDGNIYNVKIVGISIVINVAMMLASGLWGWIYGSDYAINNRHIKREDALAHKLYIPVKFN